MPAEEQDLLEQPLILVTNDDGIQSGGLMAAAEILHPLGNVLIVAPETDQTAMGRSFPRTKDQGIIEASRGPLGAEVRSLQNVKTKGRFPCGRKDLVKKLFAVNGNILEYQAFG